MSQHAELIKQPSGFHRTLNCPGWGNMSKDIEDSSSAAATEGTLAHGLAEKALIYGTSPEKYVGWWGTVTSEGLVSIVGDKPVVTVSGSTLFNISQEMAEYVSEYVEEASRVYEVARATGFAATCEIEAKLSLEWLVPDMVGTGDFVVSTFMYRTYVRDLKYGRILVEVGRNVGDNAQLSCYSLMALGPQNINMVNEVEAGIVQPRVAHPDGTIRTVTYTAKDLLEWGRDVVVPAVREAERPDAPLRAGDWCKFCPASARCPERRRSMFANVPVRLDSNHVPTVVQPAPPSVKDLSTEQLARIIDQDDNIRSWLKDVRDELKNRIVIEGEKYDYKLVTGLGNRKFKEEEDIPKRLSEHLTEEEMYSHSLKSPAQIEAALKRRGLKAREFSGLMADLTFRPETEAKLVKVTHAQPALPPATDRFFTDIKEKANE